MRWETIRVGRTTGVYKEKTRQPDMRLRDSRRAGQSGDNAAGYVIEGIGDRGAECRRTHRKTDPDNCQQQGIFGPSRAALIL